MEASVGKSEVSDSSRKLRSLDLKSGHGERSRCYIGNSRARNQARVLKRKNVVPIESGGFGFVESTKKRSSEVLSTSSFDPIVKKRRDGPWRPNPGGFISGVRKRNKLGILTGASNDSHDLGGLGDNLHDSGCILALAPPPPPPPKKEGDQPQSAGKFESSDGLGGTISVPKRPRGVSRRKTYENSFSSKRGRGVSSCGGKDCADGPTCKLTVNLVGPSGASISKQDTGFDELKNNSSSRDNYDHHIKGGNGTSSQARRRKVRTRKLQVSAVEIQNHRENEAHSVEDNRKSSEDFFDDDEETLEENAAIMLSSRFDPRCTGFSGKRMTSSKPTNESYSQPFHKTSIVSGSKVSLVHAEGRALRPRKNNGRGFFRKRRHFYEVCYSDMDPYWVVKQRIRVFWPLDQSWYFGLVKDYDPVTKRHYVKYDDRDEEWINLQNERFKLLLFPSEVKFNSERSKSRVKKKNEEGSKNSMDVNCMGNILGSETIGSWLARSNRPMKSSPISIHKHEKIHLLEKYEPSIMLASKEPMSVGPTSMAKNKLAGYNVTKRLIEEKITQASKMEGKTDSGISKLSFVYFRKRFHGRREGLVNKLECDSACASSDGPISLLASVADREAALEELYVNVTPTKLKQIKLRSSLLLQYSHHHAFGVERFLLCSSLLLHHGKLALLWPRVHMEILFLDSARGLRWLSFEGCLRWVVALFCFIMASFYQNKKHKLSEIEAPYTSIGFNISNLHNRRGQFLFALYGFGLLESPKWRYLENKLKPQCMATWELPIEDCTLLNIKNLSSRTKHPHHTSILEYPISLEGLPKISCSDIIRQQILNNLALLNMDPGPYHCEKEFGVLPLSVLFFAPAPLFFLSMHLKLLMENKTAALGSQKPNSTSLHGCRENYDKLTGEGYSLVEDSSDQVSETTNENFGSAAASSGCLNFGGLKVETDALSVSNDDDDWERSSHNLNGENNIGGNPVGYHDVGKKSSAKTFVRSQKFLRHTKSWQEAEKSYPPFNVDSFYPDKFEDGYSSSQLFSYDEERLSDKGQRAAHCASDLVLEMNEQAIRSPTPTAPRSIWHRNRHSSVSPTSDQCSKLWPEDFGRNGFVSASRKPRTRVAYSLHIGDCDLGSKHRSHHKKERLYKKIRTDDAKKISGGLESPKGYLESLTCYANVLVTVGDQGWRECGAQVVLDSDDQKDWSLSVKFSGTIKYMHKAQQLLQPGTTNRYTHAMMWKGGKDWTLEFTDRNQWSLFKVMYEECFNRNIRAASIKNIPIPGVRLIDDGGDNVVEVPFIRSSSKYHRQVGTEVDMALDPSHILYDMDSSDDEWISNLKSSLNRNSKLAEVTYDIFERVIDMFEKVAYAEQCDRFSNGEIEEFLADFGPLEIVKAIYEHWRQKRRKKDLPLIRQFQPPLWEHYQKQLKDWELAMSKIQSSLNGCQEKSCLLEKPPMFAFCLRPRGLEIPNKGSKQKSHRKFIFTNHHNFCTREDGLHTHVRKSNGLSFGEDKSIVTVSNNEFAYSSLRLQSPFSVLPKNVARAGVLTMTSDGSDGSRYPKLDRNNSKKIGLPLSPRESRMLPAKYNESSKRNGIHCLGNDMCEWAGRTQQSQPDRFQRKRADIYEFRLRDSSNAAQHASTMAKLKREKAERLLHKADLALHKAMVALMTAEAIKLSQKDLIGDG